MKTTKGGKVMNPTDAYRKELRKKELKRNKKERKKVREVGILKKDPESIREQIEKLEVMKADGALDKARKHKKRQLEDTLNLVMKKRKSLLAIPESLMYVPKIVDAMVLFPKHCHIYRHEPSLVDSLVLADIARIADCTDLFLYLSFLLIPFAINCYYANSCLPNPIVML
ncbi:hypothetical protein M5K25_019565 [Dendrobium thyrsiflorum]|uniref:Wbp11/ELF5/Saf1 N-terminal domain-containing protein n=1 Tax=Dendrobium thyrsiflorum TaxID=117978 RepID=A0ABD0UF48_DENTH